MQQKKQKHNARDLIINEFHSQVIQSSLSQVRVKKIIESLKMNRNTFYYYFNDKYEVALWIFRIDLAKILEKNVPEKYLVYAPMLHDKDLILPYYTHHELGARTLDSSNFMKSFAECILQDREFYRKVFNRNEHEFIDKVVRLFKRPVENDLNYILSGRNLPEVDRQMFINLISRNIVLIATYILERSNNPEALLNDDINPFWNFLSESLYSAIELHPIRKTFSISRK